MEGARGHEGGQCQRGQAVGVPKANLFSLGWGGGVGWLGSVINRIHQLMNGIDQLINSILLYACPAHHHRHTSTLVPSGTPLPLFSPAPRVDGWVGRSGQNRETN